MKATAADVDIAVNGKNAIRGIGSNADLAIIIVNGVGNSATHIPDANLLPRFIKLISLDYPAHIQVV